MSYYVNFIVTHGYIIQQITYIRAFQHHSNITFLFIHACFVSSSVIQVLSSENDNT